MLRLAEPHRAPAAREHEPVPLEPLPQLVAVAEVPRWAELDPLVAGGGDLRRELLRPGHVREDPDRHLERAIGERCVADPNHAATSGTRGSFGVSVKVARIQASDGSSEAAIEWRSPASALR